LAFLVAVLIDTTAGAHIIRHITPFREVHRGSNIERDPFGM